MNIEKRIKALERRIDALEKKVLRVSRTSSNPDNTNTDRPKRPGNNG